MSTKQWRVEPNFIRATLAVARKHITVYVRYPTWFLALLIWPVLMPFSFIFSAKALAGPDGQALAAFGQLAGTTEYVGFLVVGTTFWMWFNMMLWGLGTAFRTEQMRGTLESNWLAPLPKTFMALGSFLGEAVMGLIVLAVSFLSMVLVYQVPLVHADPLALALVVAASIPPVYGIGLAFASLVLLAKEVNSFIFFVRGLMTIFCGISYPIAVLPQFMQPVSQVLPLTHSIGAVRAILGGATLAAVTGELRYLALSGAVLMATGFLIFEAVQRRMLADGTLGQY